MKMTCKKFLAAFISVVLAFSVLVPYAFAASNEISEVNITLPVPQAGEEIYAHDEIVLDNDKCRVGLIAWFSEKAGLEISAQSEVFLPDYNYSLYLDIKPIEKTDIFSEDCVVTVNGEAVEVFRSETGSFISMVYNLGEPENNSDENIFSLEVISGFIREILRRIYKIIAAPFGRIIF